MKEIICKNYDIKVL